jgi:adenine deaminase
LTARVEESLGLISVARGTGEADLYLDGGNLVNVLSGEIYPANVAVWRGKIAYVGLSRKMVGPNTRVIDAGGCYLCPGLIEAHFHPWFVYNPVSIMEVALASGTTTMLCDGLIFYINLGAERFLKMLEALENYPLRLFWTARVMSHLFHTLFYRQGGFFGQNASNSCKKGIESHYRSSDDYIESGRLSRPGR